MAIYKSIQVVCSSTCTRRSFPRCIPIWWRTWWRLRSIAGISTPLLIVGAHSHEVTLLTTLETNYDAFTTNVRMIPTNLAQVGGLVPSWSTLLWDEADLSLKFCELWPLYSLRFLDTSAVVDDVAFYLVYGIVVVLNHLCVGLTHSMSWPSCFDTLLYPSPSLLYIVEHIRSALRPMTPIYMTYLPSLLEVRPNNATNKLILLLISFTSLEHS